MNGDGSKADDRRSDQGLEEERGLTDHEQQAHHDAGPPRRDASQDHEASGQEAMDKAVHGRDADHDGRGARARHP